MLNSLFFNVFDLSVFFYSAVKVSLEVHLGRNQQNFENRLVGNWRVRQNCKHVEIREEKKEKIPSTLQSNFKR